MSVEPSHYGMGSSGAWGAGRDVDFGEQLEDEFAALIDRIRQLHDRVASTRPTAQAARAAADLVRGAQDILDEYPADESHQVYSRLYRRPGHGQALVPPVRYLVIDPEELDGAVTFSRFYVGGNSAAHGGSIPLMFDEVLGALASGSGRAKSRTAYLTVNYRSVTPLDRELTVRAHLDRQEGRKLFLSGVLTDGDTVCADAQALFVYLRPGQP